MLKAHDFIAQGKLSAALGSIALCRWRPIGAKHKKTFYELRFQRAVAGGRITQRAVRFAHSALGYVWIALSARWFVVLAAEPSLHIIDNLRPKMQMLVTMVNSKTAKKNGSNIFLFR